MKTNVSTKQDNWSGRGAFTLVEVLVAMGVIGVMFTSLYSGITQSVALVQSAEETQRAIQIIQDKTETIHLYTWSQINTPGFVPATFTNWFSPLGNSTNGGVMFTGTMTVTNASLADNPSYAGDLKQVSVTVSWTSANVNHQRQLTTLISHYGLQNYIYN